MTWQLIGLTFFSLTLLPAGLALVTGRVPRRMRARTAPMRPRGWALLGFYTIAPLNAVPRLSGAPAEITMAATLVAGVVAAAGCVFAAVAVQRAESSVS
ncbi:hypothetical protein ABZT08_03230 [Streptomyces sp. NPDC005526]|uniref:hypothetical protein n=1 Tax=Streptomyces sp. NPDC005526 TaxID=3156885 RepID=UPI0033A52C26